MNSCDNRIHVDTEVSRRSWPIVLTKWPVPWSAAGSLSRVSSFSNFPSEIPLLQRTRDRLTYLTVWGPRVPWKLCLSTSSSCRETCGLEFNQDYRDMFCKCAITSCITAVHLPWMGWNEVRMTRIYGLEHDQVIVTNVGRRLQSGSLAGVFLTTSLSSLSSHLVARISGQFCTPDKHCASRIYRWMSTSWRYRDNILDL